MIELIHKYGKNHTLLKGLILNMQDKIEKMFSSTTGLLVFSLFSGLGYFAMVLRIVMSFSRNNSAFVCLMFAPAIICGAAFFIIKTVKTNIMNEQPQKNSALFFLHCIVIFIGVIFFADMIF